MEIAMKRLALLVTLSILAGTGILRAGGGEPIKAINLEKLNTESDEDDPFVTPDNLTLYYAASAGTTIGIRVSKRAAGKEWPAGKPFLVSKEFDQRSPFIHKGVFYYATNEVPDATLKKEQNFDIWKKEGMLAAAPVLGVDEKTDELHPWITPGGKEFYFSRKTEDGWTLFIANGPTPGPIGKPRPVGFPAGFHHATLSDKALTMYLQGPLENDRTGLYRSRRAKVGEPWSKPEPLTMVNHEGGKRGDMSPCLSNDGARLYFASDRPGGKGGLDIWFVLTSQLK
jgi:hypothetical protein